MSKKNRKNKNKGNQSTTQVTAPVVTREEVEFIEDIIADDIIDVEAEVSEISNGEKTKESKSLLEKIGMEQMTEAPEFSSKEEMLAGNQGEVVCEEEAEDDSEKEVETSKHDTGMALLISIYTSINSDLLKHGIVNKVKLEDMIKLLDADTVDMGVLNNIIGCFDFSAFDCKMTELIMDLKHTIISWCETIIPLMEKEAPEKNVKEFKATLEIIKGITKDNYKTVFSELGFDIDFDSLTKKCIEEKLAGNQGSLETGAKKKETKKTSTKHFNSEKNKKAEEKISKVDNREFVHQYDVNEKLPKGTRIMSAAWYTVNNISTSRYLSDLRRVQTA